MWGKMLTQQVKWQHSFHPATPWKLVGTAEGLDKIAKIAITLTHL